MLASALSSRRSPRRSRKRFCATSSRREGLRAPQGGRHERRRLRRRAEGPRRGHVGHSDTRGWLEVSEVSAIELARRYVDLDLAAVIYTNIANDGMLAGVDEETFDDLVRLADLGLTVIASGGVTTLDDVRRLVEVSRAHPKLSGAIIGRALYEKTLDLGEALQLCAAAM